MSRGRRSNVVVAMLVIGALALGVLGFAGFSEEAANGLLFAAWSMALLALFMLALRLPLRGRGSRLSAWTATALVTIAAIAVTVAANVALYRHDVHFDVSREGRNTPPAQFTAVIDHLRSPLSLTYFYNSGDAQRACRQGIDRGRRARPPAVRVPRHRSRQGAGARSRRRRSRLQHRRVPGWQPSGRGRKQCRRRPPGLCGNARAQAARRDRLLRDRSRGDLPADAGALSLQPRRDLAGPRQARRWRCAGRRTAGSRPPATGADRDRL